MTEFLFSGPLFLMFCFLNAIASMHNTNAAKSLGTIFVLLMWILLDSPLLVFGGIAGKNRNIGFETPCKTTNCPREIPPLPWYKGIIPMMFIAGISSFQHDPHSASIYICKSMGLQILQNVWHPFYSISSSPTCHRICCCGAYLSSASIRRSSMVVEVINSHCLVFTSFHLQTYTLLFNFSYFFVLTIYGCCNAGLSFMVDQQDYLSMAIALTTMLNQACLVLYRNLSSSGIWPVYVMVFSLHLELSVFSPQVSLFVTYMDR